ncbi:MAG: hypothetical protein ACTSRS_03575 [Candidatus Helarchaeota archaeon]
MTNSWETLFHCDKCGAPLSIIVIKGFGELVSVGKCPAGHKKKFTLSLSNLKEWASIIKPYIFRCGRCDAEVNINPIPRGPWVKLIITCPVHGRNSTRVIPAAVYTAITQPDSSASLPTPSPPSSNAPTCQYCGGLTTYIPQYSRFYCYKCARYVEDKNVVEKVRQPTEMDNLKTNLKTYLQTLDTNIPHSIWEFPTQLNQPELDASLIQSILEKMISAGELAGELDPARGELILFDYIAPSQTVPSESLPSTKTKQACPTCGNEVEYIEAKAAYFCRTCFKYVDTTQKIGGVSAESETIEALRDFDYVGGQVRFKVAIRNTSKFVITNIGVELDIPSEFKLVRILPEVCLDDLNRGLAKIDKLMPGSSQGIDFYLEPVACGMGVIAGIVKYLDAEGNYKSISIKKRDVAIKCPLIFSPEEANIAMIRNLMANLSKDFRRWALPTTPPESFSLLHDLITQFEINHIQAFQISGDPYQMESWYYTRAKTTNHQIAIKVDVSELTNTIDLTIGCENMAELTGILAKISEDFKEKINNTLNQSLKPAYGSLKDLLCECGAPLPRLPSVSEAITCNACHKSYTWEMLG